VAQVRQPTKYKINQGLINVIDYVRIVGHVKVIDYAQVVDYV
jgi:hypothetical protein